jgi:hypothetical protein
MDIPWTEPQANGIEVEEAEIPQEEFEHLFGDELAVAPVEQ